MNATLLVPPTETTKTLGSCANCPAVERLERALEQLQRDFRREVGYWKSQQEHVKYAASKRDEMWIDTTAEIAKYVRERDSVSVEIVTDSEEELVVNLTDKLDDAVCDAPLTLRILTRSEWKSPLTVTQKGRKTRIELVKEAGRSCAYIEAVPDQGQIVIRPAGAAPK